MKKLVMLFILVSLIASCSTMKKSSDRTTGKASSGQTVAQDGSSYEKAVIIQEKSELTGVDAEYSWLKKNYPGYKVKSQAVTNHNNKPYDILTIITGNGEQKVVYFDISNFYGHF
ncbi:MAG TPA: hypothetical protein PKH02_09770 [Bacteroidales bacterium]|nr:hypothetical protein [Bacteroidales bacterium]